MKAGCPQFKKAKAFVLEMPGDNNNIPLLSGPTAALYLVCVHESGSASQNPSAALTLV